MKLTANKNKVYVTMIDKIRFRISALFVCLMVINVFLFCNQLFASDLSLLGLHVIPYPKEVKTGGPDFNFKNELTIVIDKNATGSDKFTAQELINDLKIERNIEAKIGAAGTFPSIVLTRSHKIKSIGNQGYQLTTGNNELVIMANGEDGLFFGTQTLLQLIKSDSAGFKVPGLMITDWPDIRERAIHYDTKHHQDKTSYVRAFIKDLSRYKVNMLVWEWEDKFAYPSHPEIGAPGAFTMKEMQDFTRYAKQYHIQIVPLVQGLGHVSFILKWPQYKPLREIESSNWEFCPLKDGSYDLLFDLWNDAVEATPGSEYIHVGSDETYELAACDNCKAKAQEVGKSGLYLLFVNKAAEYLKGRGRNVMAWETPMGWTLGDSPAKGIEPSKRLVFTEAYHYETTDWTYVKKSKEMGYEVFVYDPNPGVVPLMVPYDFEIGQKKTGSLEKSFGYLSTAAKSGSYDGMICTSWDDDDLHNQMWMLHFVNAAACSWNGSNPSMGEVRESFFKTYYGQSATDMDQLFELLNKGAYYYASTMERNVWHYGEIGKTRLPDLPRGDALEYDPFWNTENKEKINQSKDILANMDQVLQIIQNNKKGEVRNEYDFELFRTSAELIKHTCQTYLNLSTLENTIKEAHDKRFVDYNVSLNNLLQAQHIVENILQRREIVFNDLVSTYEKTRLPKGYSTNEKAYFWQQDRARHFANRQPDMSFLIYDEQMLDMEGYLKKLKYYIEFFKKNSMN
jgi:hypothetical protein